MEEAERAEPSSDHSAIYDQANAEAPGWLKVGALAAASALAGGLAAAWFYRKTLARLRQAEAEQSQSDSVRVDGDYDI